MTDRQTTPEVLDPPQQRLMPRLGHAGGLFSDSNLDAFTHLLDDRFRLPGIPVRFGLDGIIGLVPGLGDIAGGVLSCVIILAAWVRGVPYVTLARMLANLAIDVLVGAVPILGDMFDIAWKANRRNYALLTRSVEEPRKQTWRDWIFLCSLALVAGIILLIPLVLLVWIVGLLQHR